MHSSPDGVPAGSAGLVATNSPEQQMRLWAAVGFGALALLALAVAGARRIAAAKAER
jgi:hypothetical protein